MTCFHNHFDSTCKRQTDWGPSGLKPVETNFKNWTNRASDQIWSLKCCRMMQQCISPVTCQMSNASSQFLTISALFIKATIMWLRERAEVPFTPESAHRSHSTVVMSASGDQPMSRRPRRETGFHMFVCVMSLYPDAVGSCVWKSKVINHFQSLKELSFRRKLGIIKCLRQLSIVSRQMWMLCRNFQIFLKKDKNGSIYV